MAHYQITVSGSQVTLNGQDVVVPDGANPHTVAVQAAKELAHREVPAGEVVHVDARTDQGTFPMAIVDGVAMSLGEVQHRAAPENAGHSEHALQSQGARLPAEEQADPAPSSVVQPARSPEVETRQFPQQSAPDLVPPEPSSDSSAPSGGVSQDPAKDEGNRGATSAANEAPSPVAGAEGAHHPEGPLSTTTTQPQTSTFQPLNSDEGEAAEALPVNNPFAHTFIEKHRVEQTPQPKQVGGFAGVLAQFGIGGPSQAQQTEEQDKIAVSKVWTRPKGIAVANGKGGSGKTPTSLYLAAMFARFGGGMVLVDDNNTFRGAAGWQTENATHGATKEDLLEALPHFDGRERAADMARFTHHQTTDRYDVLQSRPQKLAKDQALDDEQFDAIQDLLRRFYRVVVFDSGNDESAPNWLRMIHHSDALVVPTATTPKHCESAKLLLEALTAQGGHSKELARNAVIVVSHASTNDPVPEQVAPRFAGMAREVLTIPHDPAMAKEWLRWDDLAPKTQRAWLAVGAALARGMED